MLILDLVFHRNGKKIEVTDAIKWTIFWISLAFLFNIYIYLSRGGEDAINFLTGYLIEKCLSVDNLFLFLLIFKYFKTPEETQHKVLFYGVLGAILFRALFIWIGISLVTYFHWTIYLFGLFLIISGIKIGLEKDKDYKPEKNFLVRILKVFFPITHQYDKAKFFTIEEQQYKATPLFLALLCIETTDLLFALDSVPAVFAITYDPFIVYTSNIFAILGLRSLFFVLSHAMSLYHYLHYAISFILVFVGMKMLLSDIYKLNSLIALGIILLTLGVSIFFSIRYPQKKGF